MSCSFLSSHAKTISSGHSTPIPSSLLVHIFSYVFFFSLPSYPVNLPHPSRPSLPLPSLSLCLVKRKVGRSVFLVMKARKREKENSKSHSTALTLSTPPPTTSTSPFTRLPCHLPSLSHWLRLPHSIMLLTHPSITSVSFQP